MYITAHGGGWGYSPSSVEAVRFSPDAEILLGGFGLYGGRGTYNAEIKVNRREEIEGEREKGEGGGEQEGEREKEREGEGRERERERGRRKEKRRRRTGGLGAWVVSWLRLGLPTWSHSDE